MKISVFRLMGIFHVEKKRENVQMCAASWQSIGGMIPAHTQFDVTFRMKNGK